MDSQGELEKMRKYLGDNIKPGLDEMVQEELGRLIRLLPDIGEDSYLIKQVEIAGKALLQEQPNVKLAVTIREDIEKRLDEVTVQARQKALVDSLKEAIQQERNAGYQEELAQFVQLIPDIDDDYSLLAEMEVAAQAFLQDKPNMKLAVAVREDIKKRLRKKHGFRSLFSGPTWQVIAGVLIFFVLMIPLILLVTWICDEKFRTLASRPFVLAIMAGALGGLTRLMVRMPDLSRLRDVEFPVLFTTGCFRPLIGMAFAIFVAAIMESNFLNVNFRELNEPFFYVTLGYISGFSEIFARGIMTKTEATITSLARKKQS
jgi:hypothetical protein